MYSASGLLWVLQSSNHAKIRKGLKLMVVKTEADAISETISQQSENANWKQLVEWISSR